MADKQATYTAKVETNAPEVAQDTASALRQLQASVLGSMQSIKDYQTSLRALRGTSDEVKAAKEKLKAGIDAEKNSMSANTAALLKAGTSTTRSLPRPRKLATQEAKKSRRGAERRTTRRRRPRPSRSSKKA